jgi:hypothetical protein
MAENERTESAGHFEMLWDCEFCEAKGLLAKTQRHCAECGAKQNPDKRYFPKEGEEQKIDGHKYEGADKVCPNCDAPMGKLAHNCTNCGAAQDGAREVKGVATPVVPVAKKKSKWWIWLIVGVVVLVGIVVLVKYCNRTEEKTITVAAHRWEMSIGVEEYGNERKSDWEDHMPRNAQSSSCVMKQRTTKKVPDGEDCKMEKVDKKDGTFEKVKKCTPKFRSEPVDDRWCTFTVREWREIDRIKTAGNGTTPAWPASGLPPEQYTETLGAKRRGSKKASYLLDMSGLETKQTCDVSEAVWKKYSDNQKAKVEVKSRTGEVVCDSL